MSAEAQQRVGIYWSWGWGWGCLLHYITRLSRPRSQQNFCEAPRCTCMSGYRRCNRACLTQGCSPPFWRCPAPAGSPAVSSMLPTSPSVMPPRRGGPGPYKTSPLWCTTMLLPALPQVAQPPQPVGILPAALPGRPCMLLRPPSAQRFKCLAGRNCRGCACFARLPLLRSLLRASPTASLSNPRLAAPRPCLHTW
jgi:hypothetical protein